MVEAVGGSAREEGLDFAGSFDIFIGGKYDR